MYDRLAILHLVNDAERRTPRCTCGAPMVATDHADGLWLECASRREPQPGLLARLRSLDWLVGHDRSLILAAEELRAA